MRFNKFEARTRCAAHHEQRAKRNVSKNQNHIINLVSIMVMAVQNERIRVNAMDAHDTMSLNFKSSRLLDKIVILNEEEPRKTEISRNGDWINAVVWLTPATILKLVWRRDPDFPLNEPNESFFSVGSSRKWLSLCGSWERSSYLFQSLWQYLLFFF